MEVLILSRYGNLGASSRMRMYQFQPFLREHGFNLTLAPMLDDAYLRHLYSTGKRRTADLLVRYWQRVLDLRHVRRFDLVWLEKELFPFLPPIAEVLLGRWGVPYAVDYDDAVFHNYDLHPNKWVRLFLGRKVDRVMEEAAMVVVGNPYLADRASQAGAKRVEIVPTVVDLARYSVDTRTSDGQFRVGWIGSPSTTRFLQAIDPVIANLERTAGSPVHWVLIGAANATWQTNNLENRAWSEAREVQDLLDIDVGVMPLPDEPFERGKCGYKLIQYMACGKPVVASPVGVNREIVMHGENGFLASTPSEWREALEMLRQDPNLRLRMGQAGRRIVEQRYSLQVVAPRLHELLRATAKSPG